jgi:hypothetical protein
MGELVLRHLSLAVSLILAAPHLLSAQARGLAGSWAIAIGTTEHPEYRTLEVTVASDGTIRGTIGSPSGGVPIQTGRANGSKFTLEATLGTGLRLSYDGIIANDTIRGTWRYDKFEGRFIGVRGTTPPRPDTSPLVRGAAAIDARMRAATIDSLAAEIRRRYVEPASVGQIIGAIRDRERSGAYDSLSTPPSFARGITEDLRKFDKHFALIPVTSGSPPGPQAGARDNYAIKRVERLDGNIGYLKLDVFSTDSAGAAPVLRSALRFLARADALILDLRENRGGAGDLSHMLFSYLAPETGVVADIFMRTSTGFDSSVVRAAEHIDSDAAFRDRPVYVLTSAHTASAAEWLAYDLQAVHRATIIGETTAGASHPIRFIRVNDAFDISMPAGRVRSRFTKTDFEQVGVQPDVKTTSDLALKAAYLESLTTLLARTTDPRARTELERAIAAQKANG